MGAPSESESERADRELALVALRKQKAGRRPTRQEAAALRRWEKNREERLRWEHYETIPQKHWRQMSGRQTKVLHEQAASYGIPFGEAVINLPAVVRALHDFLAKNARRLAVPEDDDPLLAGGNSAALEEYRRWRAKGERLAVLRAEGELLPREDVREHLAGLAGVLRKLGERLQRDYGPEAGELLEETLADFERQVRKTFETPEEEEEAGE